MKLPSKHLSGVILVLVSALVFSLAGVFTKSIASGAWEIAFWRGIFAAGFTIVYVLWRGKLRLEFLNMGRSGLAVAVINASGSVSFITAFKLTTMANVILIYASVPLMAAVLAWFWAGERLTLKLTAASLAAFAGVLIILQGSFGGISLRGDLLALWMTIALAIIMVIYRRYPETPAAGPAALSSIIIMPLGMAFGEPMVVPSHDLLLAAAFGLSFAIASVTFAEGAKRISAAEVALLSTMETPLAPILGWIFFAEVPALATIIGGAIIFFAVLASQVSK